MASRGIIWRLLYNNDGLEVRYGYDALNRIRHIRYGNGVETAYTYDGDGNIRTLETKAGENVLLSFAYQYDGNGNRTAKTGMQAALGGITAGNNALDISYNYGGQHHGKHQKISSSKGRTVETYQ